MTVDKRPSFRHALAAAAVAGLALLSTGCAARVHAHAAYVGPEWIVYDDGPIVLYDIDAYPHYWYGGTYVYLVDDRWYFYHGDRWAYYRAEPEVLHAYRTDYYGRFGYREAPPYGAPPPYRGHHAGASHGGRPDGVAAAAPPGEGGRIHPTAEDRRPPEEPRSLPGSRAEAPPGQGARVLPTAEDRRPPEEPRSLPGNRAEAPPGEGGRVHPTAEDRRPPEEPRVVPATRTAPSSPPPAKSKRKSKERRKRPHPN
jgi:hypothetical protein